MRKLDFYWQTNEKWFYINANGTFVLKSDAPNEAEKSYLHYLEQIGVTREEYEKIY